MASNAWLGASYTGKGSYCVSVVECSGAGCATVLFPPPAASAHLSSTERGWLWPYGCIFPRDLEVGYWFSCAEVCGRAFLVGPVLDVALISAQERAESKPSMLQVFWECYMDDTGLWDWGHNGVGPAALVYDARLAGQVSQGAVLGCVLKDWMVPGIHIKMFSWPLFIKQTCWSGYLYQLCKFWGSSYQQPSYAKPHPQCWGGKGDPCPWHTSPLPQPAPRKATPLAPSPPSETSQESTTAVNVRSSFCSCLFCSTCTQLSLWICVSKDTVKIQFCGISMLLDT